ACPTAGAIIYYTLDGTLPTANSSVYAGTLLLNGGVTLRAFAVASEHLDSAVRSVFYQLVQTETPVFTPASGPVSYGTNISISCATPGSRIYYTVDGTTPSTNSAI